MIDGVPSVMYSGDWLMLKLPVVTWATAEPYKPPLEQVSVIQFPL